MDEFTRYYLRQVGKGVGEGGGGTDEVGAVYRGGFSRGQRGRGMISNALKSLWNFVSPLFTSGAQAVGRQALDTGAKILTDAAAGEGSTVKERLIEGRDNLVRKMQGKGRGRKKKKSKRVGRKMQGKKKQSKRTKGDIFDGI